MPPKDIDISLTEGVLTIRGEKKQERKEKEENYHFVERSYGSFNRSIRLPGEIQGDKIKASCKEGVLKITLPKTEETKKKELKIKVERSSPGGRKEPPLRGGSFLGLQARNSGGTSRSRTTSRTREETGKPLMHWTGQDPQSPHT
jgi:hypothetical protein